MKKEFIEVLLSGILMALFVAVMIFYKYIWESASDAISGTVLALLIVALIVGGALAVSGPSSEYDEYGDRRTDYNSK